MQEITELKEVQKLLNEMLLDFEVFCEQHNLTFFLEGGTLLGAARHKGFIPWDDDIDISMRREDYDRLLELTNSKIIEGKLGSYKIASSHDKKMEYPFPFAKFMYLETVLDEYVIHPKFRSHLFIDIFPIDYIPENKREQKKLFDKNRITKKYLSFSILNYYRGNIIKRIAKRVLFFPLRTVGYRTFRDRIEKNSKNNSPSPLVGVTVWGYANRGIMDLNDYLNPKKLLFNNKEYYVPNNYQTHLKRLYGDYMQLPPKEEQIPRHMYRVWRKRNEEE